MECPPIQGAWKEDMGPDEIVRIGYIAQRHYRDGRSRVEIADELGLSRFKVARMLESAIEQGIVTISIQTPESIDFELSMGLRNKFGLKRALAVAVPNGGPEATQDALGKAAADLLTEITIEGDVIGLTAGRTLTAMSRHLTRLAMCEVVQLAGVAGPAADNGIEVIRTVSRVSGGRARSIYAPLLVEDAATARALRREPTILDTLRRFDAVTKAVLAVGSWSPPDSQLYDNARQVGVLDALLASGVQAELCSTLLDSEGREIEDVSERSIAITTAQLRKIPDVIAVAGGPLKTAAVHSVLKSGIVGSLITDTALAQRLLQPDIPAISGR